MTVTPDHHPADVVGPQPQRWRVSDGLTIVGDHWGDPNGDPVLLHGGGQNRHAWAATAARAAVPHTDHVDVRNAGHMVAGDDNDTFAAAIIAFLNANRTTR